MHNKDTKYFNVLKMEVVRTFKESYPGADDQIEDWKGQTIVFFQDDLLEKVNENISEKWFYNHMKSTKESLPRIDMLNILSKYCGYADWQEFTFKNKIANPDAKAKDKSNRVFIYVSVLTLTLLAIFYVIYTFSPSREYQLSFINADDLSPLTSHKIIVEILKKDESPQIYSADSTGLVSFKTKDIEMKFVVSAPYYKTDTIVRILKKYDRKEIIKLHRDDYALMLHYFSSSNLQAWNKRKSQLQEMFADHAIIYEVYHKGSTGIEMYDKIEFINKITLPSKTIKEMEILNIEYEEGKIIKLRFSR